MADVKPKRASNIGAKKTGTKNSNSSGKRSQAGSTNKNPRKNGAKRRKANVSFEREILVLLLFALSVFLMLSNFKLCGQVGEAFTNLTFGVFGIIGYIVPVIMFGATVYFVATQSKRVSAKRVLSLLMLLSLLCGISQLIYMTNHENTDLTWKGLHDVAMTGHAGGAIGGAIIRVIHPLFGYVGSYVLLIFLILVFFILVTGISVTEIIKNRSASVKKSKDRRDRLREVRQTEKKALRQIREEEKDFVTNRKLEEKKQASDRRIEQARKQHEARMMLKGKQSRISFDATGDMVSSENRVKNPVIKETVKNEEIVTPVSEVNSMEEQTFTITVNNETSSVSMPAYDIKTEETPWNDKVISIPKTQENEINYDPFVIEPEDNTDDFTDTDAPVYDNTHVVSQKNKAAVIEKMKRSGANADGTKTIVTASGQIKTIEMDMGSERHVAPMKREGESTIFDDVSEALQPLQLTSAPKKDYVFPPIDLLTKGSGAKNMNAELQETAAKLQQTLQTFGVRVKVTNVSCGPAVTRYELTPEMGVKVSSIVRLQDDIKLNMAASDIRIEAPIPGKAAIGIEIPNKESSSVMLRDLLEGPEFRNHPSKLAFGAGKDIGGQTVISDVAKMPHLLIAGATGSGKSVCINTIIMSIIYKAKPDEVKLIMIDPKVVELSVYNGIPHLFIPVVIDPKKAAGALSWAVAEMTQRYKKFAEFAVRDLKGYNEKLKENCASEDEYEKKKLPQLVIIVDELADLMMVAPGDVEDSICRLAQMARAAGIHLILATQRPSVNVITGLIKANVPSRIAFSVSSGVDSRTILDMVGAEKLLGRGDMLYFPAGMQKPIRVQGAFVSDKEVSKVVEFVTKQGDVKGGQMNAMDDIERHIENASASSDVATGSTDQAKEDRNSLDPLFREAGLLIVGKDKASIGMLQRAFRIGFNRAARIMEQLADAGLVGEEEGTKPRRVLMDEPTFVAYCDDNNIN